MKDKLSGILKNYFFTGYIIAQNIAYLKGLLIIGLSLIQLRSKNENVFQGGVLLESLYFIIYPAVVAYVLYHFKSRLDEPNVRERIG